MAADVIPEVDSSLDKSTELDVGATDAYTLDLWWAWYGVARVAGSFLAPGPGLLGEPGSCMEGEMDRVRGRLTLCR